MAHRAAEAVPTEEGEGHHEEDQWDPGAAATDREEACEAHLRQDGMATAAACVLLKVCP